MIEFNHVFKKYEGNNFYSSNDISFRIKENVICGLIGHNGAGKSTIIKMLSTIQFPDKGQIKINNLDIFTNSIQIKKNLGIVYETPRLYEELTGEENIIFLASLFNLDKEIIINRLTKFYRELNIDFQNKLVSTYSKGMKQKISLIRALITEPKIILMDEPTSGLDIASRVLVKNYILNLKNKTIILTSHNAKEIEELCDQIIILNRGKIYENSNIKDLKNKYNKNSFEEIYIEIQKNIERNI